MAILSIHLYGDPILRTKAESLEEINEKVRDLVDDMIEIMQEKNGIGLAANQVGVLKRIIAIDLSNYDEQMTPLALINPEITAYQGKEILEEGCLSIPEIFEEVERYSSINVNYQTIYGEHKILECGGLLARTIQHEIDHLDGILFVDKISAIKRKLLSSKLKKIMQGSLIS